MWGVPVVGSSEKASNHGRFFLRCRQKPCTPIPPLLATYKHAHTRTRTYTHMHIHAHSSPTHAAAEHASTNRIRVVLVHRIGTRLRGKDFWQSRAHAHTHTHTLMK